MALSEICATTNLFIREPLLGCLLCKVGQRTQTKKEKNNIYNFIIKSPGLSSGLTN